MLLIELLPYRQLVTAGSPGSPHEDDELLATIVAEARFLTIQSRQREIGCQLAYLGYL